MAKVLIGSCTGHEDPNLWYVELPKGGQTPRTMAKIVARIDKARAICDDCPIKQECLTEGMKDINLAHGMWGGLLSGERVEIAMANGYEFTERPTGYRPPEERGEPSPLRRDEMEHSLFFLEKVRAFSANI